MPESAAFEDNSFAAKLRAVPAPAPEAAEPKKNESVVTTPVQVRRATVGDFFAGLGGRLVDEAKNVLVEHMIPAAKVMAVQAGNNLLASIFKVDPNLVSAVTKPITTTHGLGTPHTNYQKISTPGKATVAQPVQAVQQNRYEFSKYVMGTRPEAQVVLDKMFMHIGQYNVVNVQDLFEFMGVTPEWVDNNHGWTSLNGAVVAPHPQGGWYLKLPRPERLMAG